MADSPAKTNLKRWFDRFRAMKVDCARVNGTAAGMDLLTFGNTTITGATGMLISAPEQNQFCLNVKNDPALGFDVATSDLTTFPTFKGLLDHFTRLQTRVDAFLTTLAAGNPPDFESADLSAVFPGGSTGAQWTNANNELKSVFPAECFTAKLQTAAAKTVDTAGKKGADLAKQIAALG